MWPNMVRAAVEVLPLHPWHLICVPVLCIWGALCGVKIYQNVLEKTLRTILARAWVMRSNSRLGNGARTASRCTFNKFWNNFFERAKCCPHAWDTSWKTRAAKCLVSTIPSELTELRNTCSKSSGGPHNQLEYDPIISRHVFRRGVTILFVGDLLNMLCTEIHEVYLC